MKASPKLTKIPGNVMPIAETDNRIKDLTTLTKLELLDLKQREKRLLSNERQLDKLPDKGARIRQLYDRILAEEERRSCLEDATRLFSNLNIADHGSVKLTAMEWKNGNIDVEAIDKVQNDHIEDSDDEHDVNLLKIIAQRSKNEQEKSVNVEAELVELDLDSIKPKLGKVLSTAHKHQPEIDAHSHHLIEKTEQLSVNKREKFKPFKTTIHNTHDPAKEMARKPKKNWENTAATPPLIQHKGTQMVSLKDSVQIQNEYILRMKELQTQQAMERLKLRNSRLSEREKLKEPTAEDVKTNILFSKYRDNIEGHLQAEEKDNDDDLAEEDKSNVVNYTFSA